MEGSIFPIRERLNSSEDVVCPQCGHLFRPGPAREEPEDLCEICSTAQFDPPNRLARWQAIPKRAGRAAR